MTYLITFACYGTHLHGDETGSVDDEHHIPGTRLLAKNWSREATARRLMDQPPYCLNEARRKAVLAAIQEVCTYRGWTLLAAHVRTNHVHTVVDAEAEPEAVMHDFKSYASRRLNAQEPACKRWGRHGSTCWLWKPERVSAAIDYVVREQGEVMPVFELVLFVERHRSLTFAALLVRG